MSFGPDDGSHVLIVPPLFEELNRTRKLLSDLMRTLASRGVATDLPDLPGTGESETALIDVTWQDWRQSVADACAACSSDAIFSVRGGCLLDDTVKARALRFSPVEGKRLIRDLVRSRILNDKAFDSEAQKAVFTAGPTLLGGYPVSAELATAVRDAELSAGEDIAIIRLESEHGDADTRIAGSPLWRRAEPSGSVEQAEALADAIIGWLD